MYHLFDVKTTTSMYVINVVFFSFLTTGTRRSIKVLRRIESARALLSKEHSYYRTTTTILYDDVLRDDDDDDSNAATTKTTPNDDYSYEYD